MYIYTIEGEDNRKHKIAAETESEALSIVRESRDNCDFARVVKVEDYPESSPEVLPDWAQ